MVTKDFFRIFAEILIVHSYQNITPSLSNQPIYILALASSIISVFQTSLSIYLPWPVPSISVFQTSLSIYLQYTYTGQFHHFSLSNQPIYILTLASRGTQMSFAHTFSEPTWSSPNDTLSPIVCLSYPFLNDRTGQCKYKIGWFERLK